MRALHVISGIDSRAGGPAMAVAGLVRSQHRAAGIGVTLLAACATAEQDLADPLRAAGVDVRIVAPCRGPLGRNPTLATSIADAAKDADVVHIHALWSQVQHDAAVAARRLHKPYIITPHGMLTRWSIDQKRWKKLLYLAWRQRADLNGAAAIHYTSTAERDDLSPLGVELNEFESLPSKGTFRDKHPEIAGRRIVLFLGRIHPGKGMEYLVPAFAKAQLSDAVLVAVGPDSGGFQARIEQMVRENGLSDRVLFTGMLRGRDRVEALVDADLLALPSEHENFGVVVVEALACGTPVLVSDGVGIAGEVAGGNVGAVTTLAADSIAGELRRWMGDEALRQAASERARPFVWERFNWESIARRWGDHYRSLLK
jgi:glycosyltransferase involved in cell wall biosynthesis